MPLKVSLIICPTGIERQSSFRFTGAFKHVCEYSYRSNIYFIRDIGRIFGVFMPPNAVKRCDIHHRGLHRIQVSESDFRCSSQHGSRRIYRAMGPGSRRKRREIATKIGYRHNSCACKIHIIHIIRQFVPPRCVSHLQRVATGQVSPPFNLNTEKDSSRNEIPVVNNDDLLDVTTIGLLF